MQVIELYISENKKILQEFIFNLKLIQKKILLIVACTVFISLNIGAQSKNPADTIPYLNLDECILYALQHQPGVLQSGIGIDIAKKTNAVYLSGWIPQVNLGGDFY